MRVPFLRFPRPNHSDFNRGRRRARSKLSRMIKNGSAPRTPRTPRLTVWWFGAAGALGVRDPAVAVIERARGLHGSRFTGPAFRFDLDPFDRETRRTRRARSKLRRLIKDGSTPRPPRTPRLTVWWFGAAGALGVRDPAVAVIERARGLHGSRFSGPAFRFDLELFNRVTRNAKAEKQTQAWF